MWSSVVGTIFGACMQNFDVYRKILTFFMQSTVIYQNYIYAIQLRQQKCAIANCEFHRFFVVVCIIFIYENVQLM